MTTIEGYDEAIKSYFANISPRAARLSKLESYVNGEQYRGRVSFWDDSVPLQERAPCFIYPIVSIAIESNIDLVLGEGRFPEFSSKPDEDTEEEASGSDKEDSLDIDEFLTEHHRLCRFKAHCRDAFGAAQGAGTAAAIHGHRNGVPFAELTEARWATPTLGVFGETLALEIKYPYLDEFQKADGKWAVRTRIYRRVIDEQADTTFLPADANPDGREPQWTPDPAKSVRHLLGFCPVVWYPLLKGCQPVNVIDGRAIHALLLDEIEALDFALSMRHRAALYAGDPQLIEIGVEPGSNPSAPGRMAMVPATREGGEASTGNPIQGGYVTETGPSKQARRRGAGIVYQYESPETKVELLTLPGDALTAVSDNASDIMSKLQEGLGVVLLDPQNLKFASTMSGKALQAVKQRQVDRCDKYRDDFENGFLKPSIDMQLRIAARVGKQLRVPGSAEMAQALAKFQKETPDAVGVA